MHQQQLHLNFAIFENCFSFDKTQTLFLIQLWKLEFKINIFQYEYTYFSNSTSLTCTFILYKKTINCTKLSSGTSHKKYFEELW